MTTSAATGTTTVERGDVRWLCKAKPDGAFYGIAQPGSCLLDSKGAHISATYWLSKCKFARSSTWTTIVRECGNLSSKGINFLSHMKRKVGNGLNTLFWVDSWLTDIPLKQLYPRMFALDCNKNSTVAEKINASSISCSFRRLPRGSLEEEQFSKLIEDVNSVILSVSNDRWIWSLDSSGEFSIKSTRLFIDDHLLLAVGAPTRWVSEVPIKINIMAWKVSLDKLPTRLNLSLRGIEIPSITCPICSCAGESCSHLFFSCSMARNITTKLARWWEFDCPDLFSYDDWLEWFHTLRLLKGFKDILEGVFYVMWWVIWKYRNQTLFGSSQPRMDMLFDEIVLLSFTWCSNSLDKLQCKAMNLLNYRDTPPVTYKGLQDVLSKSRNVWS
ncbi:RNA-directed DNA polymerase, eukaryota [Tanacetum coccineum]